MKTTKLTNSFHNASVTIRKTDDELRAIEYAAAQGDKAAAAYIRRIRKQLCGMSDCKCGDGLGRR